MQRAERRTGMRNNKQNTADTVLYDPKNAMAHARMKKKTNLLFHLEHIKITPVTSKTLPDTLYVS